mgnify:CR=1 FL=1
MKTPKEKAKELVKMFGEYSDPYHYGNPMDDIDYFRILNAKRCALICVDEKIKSISIFTDWDLDSRSIANYDIDELEEVKREINKL